MKKSHKEINLNEGLFDTLGAIRGSLRGMASGWGSRKAAANIGDAIDQLKNEIDIGLQNYSRSLKKAGYDQNQVQDMMDAFETNIDVLIRAAIANYIPTP